MKKWSKNIISWKCGKVLYLSVVFTWQMKVAEALAKAHAGPVIAGGPAIELMGCDWAAAGDSSAFDVLAMHNPCATFTTRGCPNQCKFCIVPKIEGDFIELDSWKPGPVICDNNFLAASNNHIKRAVDLLRLFPYVDFNQGLDARLLTRWHLEQFSRLQGVNIRFAFDHSSQETKLAAAIELVKKAGFKDIGVYVLIGYNDTPDDALYRLELVRLWGARTSPMRFQPLDAISKNSFVAPGWNEIELRRIMRYYSRLIWLGHIPYSEYSQYEDMPNDLVGAR